MIRDLSQTLRSLLTQKDLPAELATAQVTFEHPTESFNPSQTTLNLFLYDLRENAELRDNEPTVERRLDTVLIRPPMLRLACTYLVTAWPVGGEELALQEHRLLGQALLVFKRYPVIPGRFLQGSLKGQTPPLAMLMTQAESLKEPHEFWTAIGNKLRPSFAITVTIAMEMSEPEAVEAHIVHLHEVDLSERSATGNGAVKISGHTQAFTIGGRIMADEQTPAKDVTVTLLERNLSAKADADGRYVFRKVLAGKYNFRIQHAGATLKDIAVTIPAPKGEDYNIRLG